MVSTIKFKNDDNGLRSLSGGLTRIKSEQNKRKIKYILLLDKSKNIHLNNLSENHIQKKINIDVQKQNNNCTYWIKEIQ